MDENDSEALRRRLRSLEEENAALRETAALYGTLIDHGEAGIWKIRPNGETVFANPTMCALLEVDGPEALVGRSAFEFFTDASIAAIARERVRREQGIPSTYEVELVGARGTHRHVIIAGAPLLDADGVLSAMIATITDVTEERRALDELRRSRARLDLAQDAAEVAIFEWDVAADRVTSWFAGRVRQTQGTLIASIEQSIVPEHRERVRSEIEAAIADPRCARFASEYQAVLPDGAVRWRHAKVRVSRDASGKPTRLAGASIDVTDKKHLELRVAASERLESLGRLAGGVAHDFNNLLTIILTMARLVREGRVPAAQGLDDLIEAGERAARVTRGLLVFARRQVIERVPVDMTDALARSRMLLERVLGEDVVLSIETTGGAVVLADPGQLDQVMINLASNARDAMPAGGRLRIELEREGELVVLRFRDEGIGMDEHTRERAMEPFFSTKAQGSGLGLATTYGIVTQLGGSITMSSEPGRGTTVEVRLPVADVAVEAEVASANERRARRGETVLIVDDQAGVRRVLRKSLEVEGFTVRDAPDGRAALALLDGVDGLVTDVRMPGMDGPSLANEVRARAPRLPIVFVSGYAEDAATDDPRTVFHAKPFAPSELLRAIVALLDS